MGLIDELNERAKDEITIVTGIDALIDTCYNASYEAGWWHDLNTGEKLQRNKGEMLMLMVSEIAEGMEAVRKNLMDDKLPDRPGIEVELADCVIRIADYCGGFDLDLGGAIVEKLEYNRNRADHKIENRQKDGGKSF
jgi:NTP pyrophosphatase (non-canonical NTP hydrolase)